jgi:magnesium transporter
MPTQRRLDVVLDSVRRLLRMGATANLLNLLQKQHPADLAQVLSELVERDRLAAFNTLVERNSRLAMEAASELGPETAATLLAGRPPEDVARFLQELPSDDAAAIVDYLPEELSSAVLELMGKKEGRRVENLLEYPEQTAGRIMNPNVFALAEDMTVAEAIQAIQGSRDVEMVFYLYVVDGRRHLVWRGWSPPTTCWPFPSSTRRTSWWVSLRWMTSSTSSRTRRPRTSTVSRALPATSACSPRRWTRSANGRPGSW